VEYYIQRWKIERFHFVLKSGCKVEEIQQRSYDRMKPMLLLLSVIAIYIMVITFIGRVFPNMPCSIFFADDEWKFLYTIVNNKPAPAEPYTMEEAVQYIGELGGYKRAPSDGPPGLKVVWKGLSELYKFMTKYAIVLSCSV